MQPEYSSLSRLIAGWLFGTLTKRQQTKLENLAKAKPEVRRIMDRVSTVQWFDQVWAEYQSVDPLATWELIRARIANQPGVLPLPDLFPLAKGSEADVKKESHIWPMGRTRAWIAATILAFGLVAYMVIRLGNHPGGTSNPGEPPRMSAEISSDRGAPMMLGIVPVGWLFGEDDLDFYKPQEGVLVCSYAPQIHPDRTSERRYKISTPADGIYSVVLPEGSAVEMGPASTLFFTTAYGKQSRDLTLTGDGFFAVKPTSWAFHNEKKPFVVHIPSPAAIKITAWGTRFQVEAHDPDNGAIQATLFSGVIMVQRGEKTWRLQRPGEAYMLNKDGSDTVESIMDAGRAMAQTTPMFLFQSEPIDHILHDLSRYYHVRFAYKDTIADSFSFQAPKSMPIDSLLREIERAGHIHFSPGKGSIIVSR